MPGTSDLNKNETAVYDELVRRGSALTAYELLDSVRPSGIRSPTQVYRALERLAEKHLVHRVESMNAFIACTHAHDDAPNPDTVGFAICDECGIVTEIDLSALESILYGLADKSGFRTEHSRLELRGKCRNCKTS
jgi:Fur family zinc uptake transcriptional regulator